MRARSRRGQGCPLSEPRSLLAQFAGPDARQTADARVSFSWLLLFGQAKRSNSAAMDGRRKSHGCESLLAIARQKQKAKSKWIPAFAGMTNPTPSPPTPLEGEGQSEDGLQPALAACPSGHSPGGECSLRHPAFAVRLSPE